MMVGIAGTRKAAGFSRNGGLMTGGRGRPRINCLSSPVELGFIDGLLA